jgi:glycosyltransferase involved in cell wall biosynthesis
MSIPILTIAISTFNRAERLRVSLSQIQKEINSLESPHEIELLVVDNASTDDTFNFLQTNTISPIRIIRNSINQGMLGNLNICALRATGRYIWCIGDDDFLIPGMLKVVIDRVRTSSNPLIYLNYAHALAGQQPNESIKYKEVEARIQKSGVYTLRDVVQANSNLMTAIYTLILRRDQAIACFSVVTNDLPFSSLNACVPTTVFALSLSPETKAEWIAEPVVAVDLRVSWMRYAPIWILERFPEIILEFESWGGEHVDFRYVLEEMGPGIKHWLDQSNSSEFEQATDFKFIIGLFKLYGNIIDSRVREEFQKFGKVRRYE